MIKIKKDCFYKENGYLEILDYHLIVNNLHIFVRKSDQFI